MQYLHPKCQLILSHTLFVGLNVKLLVAKSGEQVNPQNKIVAALATVIVGDMMIRWAPTKYIHSSEYAWLRTFIIYFFVSLIAAFLMGITWQCSPFPCPLRYLSCRQAHRLCRDTHPRLHRCCSEYHLMYFTLSTKAAQALCLQVSHGQVFLCCCPYLLLYVQHSRRGQGVLDSVCIGLQSSTDNQNRS